MADAVEIRVHGDSAAPTLIYLPGIHGDWTLVTSFRLAVAGRVRFVEFNYPRTTVWTLADYARAVLTALEAAGIDSGWLLAESFGSQVGWALLDQVEDGARFRPQGLVLAGGFVRYPCRPNLRAARIMGAAMPDGLLRAFLMVYRRYARFRHRQAPETLAAVDEFVRRRLAPGDREALVYRMDLIAGFDPRAKARVCQLPTWYLSGFWDPIVPWPPVRRWLRRECPGWRGGRILAGADHAVLATQPHASARCVLDWMWLPGGREA